MNNRFGLLAAADGGSEYYIYLYIYMHVHFAYGVSWKELKWLDHRINNYEVLIIQPAYRKGCLICRMLFFYTDIRIITLKILDGDDCC